MLRERLEVADNMLRFEAVFLTGKARRRSFLPWNKEISCTRNYDRCHRSHGGAGKMSHLRTETHGVCSEWTNWASEGAWFLGCHYERGVAV